MALLEREALLDELGRHLALARHGRGHIVLVGGEAGAGKTALVDAFCSERAAPAVILSGACDAALPSRPFAPIWSMAERAGGSLARALAAGDRQAVFEAVLETIRRSTCPVTLVVLEDLHWADEPTLDLISFIGRRLSEHRALVLGSLRTDEVDPTHPLRQALTELPRGLVSELAVPPLSVTAVRRLARGTAIDAAALHEASKGNAFFVTEAIHAGGRVVPRSVQAAVLARTARTSPAARDVVRAASVIGYPAEPQFLAAAAGRGPGALEECLHKGVLVQTGSEVGFRHDLARLAVLDSVPTRTRRAVHARALRVLRSELDAELTRLAAHAIGARDREGIAATAPAAAEQAASLGSHRDAALLFAAAVSAVPEGTRLHAELLERHAEEASLADDFGAALDAQRDAVAEWREIGDAVREGNARRGLSAYMWFAGDGAAAIAEAGAAVAQLEQAAPRSPELALALATLAQRMAVSATDDATALALGRRALALAEELRLEHVAVHALITVGGIEAAPIGDPAGIAKMEEAWRRAAAAGLADEAARALINLAETAASIRDYETASRHADRADAWLATASRQNFIYLRLLRTRRMEIELERGQWEAAELDATELLQLPATATQVKVRALTTLGRLRARRGEHDAFEVLEEALRLTGPGEVQEVVPVHAARAEAASLEGDEARARREATIGFKLAYVAETEAAGWWWGELAFWARSAGALAQLPPNSPEPYRLHDAGRFREAAAAWARIDCPFQAAMALADAGDPDDIAAAVARLDRLGAYALARRIATRLRPFGIRRLPRGPYAASRSNPARLSRREVEVLGYLRSGAGDAEIAEALTLSRKTVGHHVSSILHKLGSHDRRTAVAEATRLGL